MTVVKTKTFKSGNSEAIRLPKEIAYGVGTEVEITREGDVITIRPKRKSFREMLDRLKELPAPEEVEVRDPDIFPDREGL